MKYVNAIGLKDEYDLDKNKGVILYQLDYESIEDEFKEEYDNGYMEFLLEIADKDAYPMFMGSMYFNREDIVRLRDKLN